METKAERWKTWLVVTGIVVQVVVPVVALIDGVPSRFGFHMFAGQAELRVEAEDIRGRAIQLDVSDWVVGRPELDWSQVLAHRICSDVPAAAQVKVWSGGQFLSLECT